MIISTIKHPVQTRDSKWHPLIVQNRSFPFESPVRRCTPLVMHYDFLENRSRPWHVTHDVHEHSARRREKRKREREKNEGNRFRRSWWNSCPWHWTHCGMRVHFRSRSSATWSRRCRGQLRTFKVRKKRGKRRYRHFLHAQRGEKHRRRQHPDICQPTGFSPWIYRPFSLSLSLPSVSISFQTLHTWPASLSLSLNIVIAIPSTHQRRSKFLGQLLGSSIPRENFAKLYAITREEREIFSTLSQEYLRFETDSEVLPIYRYDPSHDKKKIHFTSSLYSVNGCHFRGRRKISSWPVVSPHGRERENPCTSHGSKNRWIEFLGVHAYTTPSLHSFVANGCAHQIQNTRRGYARRTQRDRP